MKRDDRVPAHHCPGLTNLEAQKHFASLHAKPSVLASVWADRD